MYRKNRGSARIILAGGGLLSLLIVVVIIASMQTRTAETSIETKKHVEKQVEQIQKVFDEHGRVIDKTIAELAPTTQPTTTNEPRP